MNIRKIIKEEMDDFSWVNDFNTTTLGSMDYLIPDKGIAPSDLLTKIISEFSDTIKSMEITSMDKKGFNKYFTSLDPVLKVALLTYLLDNDKMDFLREILTNDVRTYIEYIRKVNLIKTTIYSIGELNNLVGDLS